MRYEISQEERAKISHAALSDVKIYPEKGETLNDIVFRIALQATLSAPVPRRMGLVQTQHQGQPRLLRPEEQEKLRTEIQNAVLLLDIDYFNGLPVKLLIHFYADHIAVSLRSWGERGGDGDCLEASARNAITTFEEVLQKANAMPDRHRADQ